MPGARRFGSASGPVPAGMGRCTCPTAAAMLFTPARRRRPRMHQDRSVLAAIAVAASPIIFALAAYPDSLAMGWNQGRGGFLFGLAFIAAELVGLRVSVPRSRILAAVPLAAAAIAYIAAVEGGLRGAIEAAAPDYGVELVFSWVWLWDYAVITAFVVAAMSLFFGRRWIRIAPAGPIFLGGSAIILALDAFFPYDSLGPLQFFVPYLVDLNVWLVQLFDLGVATARDNLMFLRGDHGPFALQVFWPSAGVHSVVIYSLVMMAFLLKMNIPRGRKSAWFAIGIAGTIGVNVVRIFALSWYALKVTTDTAKWEEFHSVAGEIMFLPWLFAFLLVVMLVEGRRLRRSGAREAEAAAGPQRPP